MKNHRILWLLLAAAALVLAGCSLFSGKKADTDEIKKFGLNPDEKVTLTLVGHLDNFEAMDAVIAKFEQKYPNCTITYQKLEDYLNSLSLRLQNQTADTQMFISFNSYLRDAHSANADYVLNYKSDPAIDLSAVNPEYLKDAEFSDGVLYCAPLMLNGNVVVVNQTLLEKNGLKIPTTFQELLDACKVLKAAGYDPIQGYIAKDPKMVTNIVSSLFIPAIENQIYHSPDFAKKATSINAYEDSSTDYFAEYFTKMQTLMDSGYINYENCSSIKDSYEDTILHFFEGKTPFLFTTAETVSGMKKRETKSEAFSKTPFTYKVIWSPTGDDGAYGFLKTWRDISINKKADHTEWSRAFINFLFKKENLNLLAQTKGLISVSKDAAVDPLYTSLTSLDPGRYCLAYQVSLKTDPVMSVLARMILPADNPQHVGSAEEAAAALKQVLADKRTEKK